MRLNPSEGRSGLPSLDSFGARHLCCLQTRAHAASTGLRGDYKGPCGIGSEPSPTPAIRGFAPVVPASSTPGHAGSILTVGTTLNYRIGRGGISGNSNLVNSQYESGSRKPIHHTSVVHPEP